MDVQNVGRHSFFPPLQQSVRASEITRTESFLPKCYQSPARSTLLSETRSTDDLLIPGATDEELVAMRSSFKNPWALHQRSRRPPSVPDLQPVPPPALDDLVKGAPAAAASLGLGWASGGGVLAQIEPGEEAGATRLEGGETEGEEGRRRVGGVSGKRRRRRDGLASRNGGGGRGGEATSGRCFGKEEAA
jgi:hypothetical protein